MITAHKTIDKTGFILAGNLLTIKNANPATATIDTIIIKIEIIF